MKTKNKISDILSTIITMIIVFIMIALFILNTSLDNKPSLWEQWSYNQQKNTALTLADLNNLPEMQQLKVDGIPESVIYAYILNSSTYPLDSDIYPVTANSSVIVNLRSAKGFRSWKLESANKGYIGTFTLPLEIQSVQPVNKIMPSVELVFSNFTEESPSYHTTFALRLKALGTYTYYVEGVNTYSYSRLEPDRDVEFYLVSADEIHLLDVIRKQCESKKCYISESINNLNY